MAFKLKTSRNTPLYSSFQIPLGDYSVCAHHFGENHDLPCVILIHGSIENSRVFFSRSGKGFAPWLARQGYDVFAIDLPGKGESIPKVNRGFRHSQTRFITHDLPEIVSHLKKLNHSGKINFVAHSWGGVLLAAMLARNPIKVNSMVFFASKRRISVFNLRRFLMVDLIWCAGGKLLTSLTGFFPAKAIGIGSDNEPADFFLQTNKWVYSKKWIDQEDGFNYRDKLKKTAIPPTLFLTGINDRILGNPVDVELLMHEMPGEQHEIQILGENYGNAHNYGHIDIMTHHRAYEDHFLLAEKWLRRFN